MNRLSTHPSSQKLGTWSDLHSCRQLKAWRVSFLSNSLFGSFSQAAWLEVFFLPAQLGGSESIPHRPYNLYMFEEGGAQYIWSVSGLPKVIELFIS